MRMQLRRVVLLPLPGQEGTEEGGVGWKGGGTKQRSEATAGGRGSVVVDTVASTAGVRGLLKSSTCTSRER